jgi:hypothetical protein
MNKKMYTVYDLKAQVHNNPMVQNNHAEAMRTFAQLSTDPKVSVSHHPEDYQLCCVGEYDEYTGKIIGYGSIEILAKAVDFVEKKVNQELIG